MATTVPGPTGASDPWHAGAAGPSILPTGTAPAQGVMGPPPAFTPATTAGPTKSLWDAVGSYVGQHPEVVPHAKATPEAATTVPGALPNPDQQYVDQFNASIRRQRQAIDNVLAASTQQLGARRDAAAAVVAGLPANFNQHFNQAQQMYGTEHGVAAGHARGNDRALGANANDRLMQGAMRNTNAAAQSTVPLLQLGVQGNYGQGLDTLNAAHLNAEGALDSQAAGFAANQASQQAGYTHADAAQAAQDKFSSDEAAKQRKWTQEHQGAPTAASQDPANHEIDLPGYGPTKVGDANHIVASQKYSSLNGYAWAAQHGPTVANAILHAMKTGNTKEAQRIWGDQANHPDMLNYLYRLYKISPTTVGITTP